jgi:hypothetical protein
MTNDTKTKKKPRVKLIGEDGNAFAILGKVKRALIKAGMREEAERYIQEATAGDYSNLVAVTHRYVDVE